MTQPFHYEGVLLVRGTVGAACMPYYFFSLDDELPPTEASEELPHDEAACEAVAVIAEELGRNRIGREQMSVSVLNMRGQIIRRVWTSSENSN
jgi:hypothetical protein